MERNSKMRAQDLERRDEHRFSRARSAARSLLVLVLALALLGGCANTKTIGDSSWKYDHASGRYVRTDDRSATAEHDPRESRQARNKGKKRSAVGTAAVVVGVTAVAAVYGTLVLAEALSD
jgi:hypothetical protein